MSKYIL